MVVRTFRHHIVTAAVPLTIISGFLGAGKTTLLNHLLTQRSGLRLAALVNDFGDLAIDGDLLAEHGGDTITFANGCVCCTLGDDMIGAIDRLLEMPNPPEQILLEASGVADPRAIADVAELHPGLKRDLTIALADGQTIRQRAQDPLLSDTVARQLAAAHVVILNKCDLLNDAERADLRSWLAIAAPGAGLAECEYARVPLEVLNGTATAIQNHHSQDHSHNHNHEASFASHFIALAGQMNMVRLRQVLRDLPAPVLRVKGFVQAATPDSGLHLVQLAGRQIDMAPWHRAVAPEKHGLMVIGTAQMPNAEELRRLLQDAGVQ